MDPPTRQPRPAVNGLVLAGGKSTRLGIDKTLLTLRGVPQREYVAGLLSAECAEVYLSLSPGQHYSGALPYSVLIDAYEGLGPFGALLTALEFAPERAWFVLAADLPLIDSAAIALLISQRDPRLPATAFIHRGYPEPLAAIWEPHALHILREFFRKGNYSPTEVLRSSLIKKVPPAKPEWLLNLNSPADLEKVKALLNREAE